METQKEVNPHPEGHMDNCTCEWCKPRIQHTPSPWFVVHVSDEKTGREEGWEIQAFNSDGDRFTVCKTELGGPFTRANMELIAVAPELLETLEALFQGFKIDMKPEIRAHVRDLLIKAKGNR